MDVRWKFMHINILQYAFQIIKFGNEIIPQYSEFMEQADGFCKIFSPDNAFEAVLGFQFGFFIHENKIRLINMLLNGACHFLGSIIISFSDPGKNLEHQQRFLAEQVFRIFLKVNLILCIEGKEL